MHSLKKLIKSIFPKIVIKKISGLFYGWHGNYKTWEKAKSKCSGYNSPAILEKVVASTLKVRNGEAIYERDSFIFDKVQYSFPLLASLMWIAAQNNGKISVLDFGGSLGSTFYQNKNFLDHIQDLKWYVVEQEGFVKEGLELFANERLTFFYTIEECIESSKNNGHPIDVILLSSVLQYLEKPYKLLDQIKSKRVKYLLIDRTQYINDSDRITVQKVNPKIYKASYPCWFFNKKEFLDYMSHGYNLVVEFDSIDETNISSESKGFLFKIKN